MKVGELVSLINGSGQVGYITEIVNQVVYVVWFQHPEWGEIKTSWTMLKVHK